jgi:hypothetical protein
MEHEPHSSLCAWHVGIQILATPESGHRNYKLNGAFDSSLQMVRVFSVFKLDVTCALFARCARNACRADPVCLSVRVFQLQNRWADFDRTWYEQCYWRPLRSRTF